MDDGTNGAMIPIHTWLAAWLTPILVIIPGPLIAPTHLSAAEIGVQCGKASWYGRLSGVTASGEPSDPSGFTAAHRHLPFGTKVQVTNIHNGRSVVVRINDRGPFVRGRVIDLSKAAAAKIGLVKRGVGVVRVTAVGDDRRRCSP